MLKLLVEDLGTYKMGIYQNTVGANHPIRLQQKRVTSDSSKAP